MESLKVEMKGLGMRLNIVTSRWNYVGTARGSLTPVITRYVVLVVHNPLLNEAAQRRA